MPGCQEEGHLIIARSLLVAALALFLSVVPTKPSVSRGNWDTVEQISGWASPVTRTENSAPVDSQSWLQGDYSVTFDEMIVATVAVATTFAAAAGSIALFVPPEAQLAVFSGLVFIAATPIDGLIIGGGAIAAYRYFRYEAADADLEVFAPSWLDNWTYAHQ